LLAAALSFLLAWQSPAGTDGARRVIRQATAAIEADSAGALRARWDADLRRNPADRAAQLGLATLARLNYLYDSAAGAYRRLLSSPGLDRFRVYARIGQAEADRIHGPLDSAAAGFTRASAEAATLSDRPAQVEALIGLALTVSRLERIDSSLRILTRAERLLPRGEPALEARLRCARAPLLVSSGKPGGREEAAAGLALARSTRDARLQGQCWQALGSWAFVKLDDPGATAAPFDSAEAQQRRSRDFTGLAETLAWSGQDHLSYGDNGRAREDFREALKQAQRSGNRAAEARASRLSGVVAMFTGVLPIAAREMQAAAMLARSRGDRAELMRLGSRLGDVASGLRRIAEAERAYREALAAAEHFGDIVLTAALRQKLAWIAGVGGDWAGAAQQLAADFEFMRRHGLHALIPSFRYSEGVFALRVGKFDRAETILRSSLETGSPTEYIARYQIRSRLAEIQLRRGEVDNALAELRAASDQLDSLREQLSAKDLRSLAFQTSWSNLEPPDHGFATLIAGFAANGRTAEAFSLTERRRARELADQLHRASAPAQPTDRDTAPFRPQLFPTEIFAVEDSTALLEYVAGRVSQPTTVFALVGEKLSAYVLPSMDSLAPTIERFLAVLQSGGDAGPLGTRLRASLLDSVLLRLPATVRRIVIVPDDILHRLPFDALSQEDGRPLIVRYAFGLVPSAAVASSLRARVQTGTTASILAFGDPDFSARSPERGSGEPAEVAAAFEEAGGLGQLPYAAREAQLVGRFARNSTVRIGAEATEAFLKRASLERIGVLHFATHALVDDWSAERTALALSPGQGEDGFLSPAEILALKIPADLVMLSACRTGAGPIVRGEGVQGLTAPLLAAGTRSVVATHWPIRDRATLSMVEAFYEHLAKGAPVVDALRSAKLEAIRRGAPAGEWAGFTVVGDPLARIPLDAPERPRLVWLVAVMLALAAAIILLRRRRLDTAPLVQR
jgi:tetratricopeptide (TPR) repeat protein